MWHIKVLQCICVFSLLYRLCYDGPFRMKSCAQTLLSTLSFHEKDAIAGISISFVRARMRHVEASGTQHLSPLAIAPFISALLCNRMARALLHPLPTEQGLLAECLPQPYIAVCAHRFKLASIRFPQS